MLSERGGEFLILGENSGNSNDPFRVECRPQLFPGDFSVRDCREFPDERWILTVSRNVEESGTASRIKGGGGEEG